MCTRPWKKDLAGHLDPEWTAPAWDQLERCPLCGERPTSHVDQILESWAGQLTSPFLGFTRRYLDENHPTTIAAKSKNCVARTMVAGTGPSNAARSCARLPA